MRGAFCIFFLLCWYSSSAEVIGYIGLFSSSTCSDDPVSVSPIFSGTSTVCVALGDTCLATLRPLAQPDQGFCVDIDVELFSNGNGVHLTSMGTTNDFEFGECGPSPSFQNCNAIYIPANARFTIRGSGTPSEPGFVAFLDYLDDGTCDVLDARIAIFEGDSTICSFDDEDNCTDQLRGQISDDSSRTCHTTSFTRDGCIVTGDDSNRIGNCAQSDFHPRCDFQFSDGTAPLDRPCGNSSSSSSGDDDETSSSGDDDDNSSDNDSSNDSSSSNSSNIMKFNVALLIVCITIAMHLI